MGTTTSVVPKIKWRVQQRFDIWHPRGWPDAEYADGSIAASIECESVYEPANVRSGEHKPLTIRFADYSTTPWRWKRLTKQAATLAEAKALFAAFLAQHHDRFAPKAATVATAATKAATECDTAGL
jgi:hypothetical protein